MCQPDVTSYDRILADGYPSQDGGVRIDGDTVFQDRVTWKIGGVSLRVPAYILGSKGNSLVQGDVVSDDGSFANYDSGDCSAGRTGKPALFRRPAAL